jgi:hypothetical protein
MEVNPVLYLEIYIVYLVCCITLVVSKMVTSTFESFELITMFTGVIQLDYIGSSKLS